LGIAEGGWRWNFTAWASTLTSDEWSLQVGNFRTATVVEVAAAPAFEDDDDAPPLDGVDFILMLIGADMVPCFLSSRKIY
jgi:hypothetical protein